MINHLVSLLHFEKHGLVMYLFRGCCLFTSTINIFYSNAELAAQESNSFGENHHPPNIKIILISSKVKSILVSLPSIFRKFKSSSLRYTSIWCHHNCGRLKKMFPQRHIHFLMPVICEDYLIYSCGKRCDQIKELERRHLAWIMS